MIRVRIKELNERGKGAGCSIRSLCVTMRKRETDWSTPLLSIWPRPLTGRSLPLSLYPLVMLTILWMEGGKLPLGCLKERRERGFHLAATTTHSVWEWMSEEERKNKISPFSFSRRQKLRGIEGTHKKARRHRESGMASLHLSCWRATDSPARSMRKGGVIMGTGKVAGK